jgi:hypothetical protein
VSSAAGGTTWPASGPTGSRTIVPGGLASRCFTFGIASWSRDAARIKPIVRARRDDPTDLTAAELAALPDATAKGDRALLALEEALNLFAAAAALPSEMSGLLPNDTFRPFSNGHEYEMWSANNCERGCGGCRNYNPNA